MDKHIFKTFRKIALSLAVKVLPLRAISFAVPEPIRSNVDPEVDAWLFNRQATVAEHVSALSFQMKSLSGTLGHLHSLVSVISTQTPMATQPWTQSSLIGGHIWSDELLFDGEPHDITPLQLKSRDSVGFLFDEVETAQIDTINIAYMADSNASLRQSVSAT